MEKRTMTRVIPLVLLSLLVAAGPSCAAGPQAEVSALSREPFYADLVARAEHLKAETEALAPLAGLAGRPEFAVYNRQIRVLAEDVMKAHLDLKARGTDNDLKCILKGVSLDLTVKMDALAAAKTETEVAAARDAMALLLGDAVDVIVTPATADSGLDCVIEFGAG